MKFVPNNKIDKVLESLSDLNFSISELLQINKSEFDGEDYNDNTIEYRYISNSIKELGPEKRDVLYKNAEVCIKSDNILQCNKILLKIINHVILEIPRIIELEMLYTQSKRYSDGAREFRQIRRDFYSQYDVLKKQFKDFGKEFSGIETKFGKFESDYKNIEKEFKRFEDRLGNIQNEFIGILSIFSAIIIAFLGGIQVLGEVFSNIKEANFYLLTMISIIIGLILFNVIYMLLYTISKIISKNIGINIYKCKSCYNANRLKCLINKYPVVFWYNSISMILFIFIFSIYILDKYLVLEYIFNSFIWMMSNKKYINLSIIFILLILLSFIFNKFIFININDKFSKISCITSNQNVSQVIENNNEVDTYQVEVATTKNN